MVTAVIAELVKQQQITDPESARGRLLKASARLFSEKGYERTTVRDIAGEVGIQSGSLFHHYRSKEAILAAVMRETIILNTQRMRIALEQNQDARSRLLALIRAELEFVLGDTEAAMGILVYEWRSLSERSQEEILALREIYEGIWLDVIDEAKAVGLVQQDSFILRRFLTGALSWTINWYRKDGAMDLDRLAEEALLLALNQT